MPTWNQIAVDLRGALEPLTDDVRARAALALSQRDAAAQEIARLIGDDLAFGQT